ncbi:hypothetical protein C8J57DRAFT_1234301 [Mycena rebaudengoi]|nr:hypothetical protein C8J57DRAFT_1234301 [Mycena rebaudengoi]
MERKKWVTLATLPFWSFLPLLPAAGGFLGLLAAVTFFPMACHPQAAAVDHPSTHASTAASPAAGCAFHQQGVHKDISFALPPPSSPDHPTSSPTLGKSPPNKKHSTRLPAFEDDKESDEHPKETSQHYSDADNKDSVLDKDADDDGDSSDDSSDDQSEVESIRCTKENSKTPLCTTMKTMATITHGL